MFTHERICSLSVTQSEHLHYQLFAEYKVVRYFNPIHNLSFGMCRTVAIPFECTTDNKMHKPSSGRGDMFCIGVYLCAAALSVKQQLGTFFLLNDKNADAITSSAVTSFIWKQDYIITSYRLIRIAILTVAWFSPVIGEDRDGLHCKSYIQSGIRKIKVNGLDLFCSNFCWRDMPTLKSSTNRWFYFGFLLWPYDVKMSID